MSEYLTRQHLAQVEAQIAQAKSDRRLRRNLQRERRQILDALGEPSRPRGAMVPSPPAAQATEFTVQATLTIRLTDADIQLCRELRRPHVEAALTALQDALAGAAHAGTVELVAAAVTRA